MRRIEAFLHLSAPERRLVIEALVLVAAIRLGLWMMSFGTLRRLLDRLMRGSRAEAAAGQVDASRVGWAVRAVSRFVPVATCLTQSLAAQVLLRRRGLGSRLHIGVTKDERQRLVAHAWVESGDQVVVGGQGRRVYTPLWVQEG